MGNDLPCPVCEVDWNRLTDEGICCECRDKAYYWLKQIWNSKEFKKMKIKRQAESEANTWGPPIEVYERD